MLDSFAVCSSRRSTEAVCECNSWFIERHRGWWCEETDVKLTLLGNERSNTISVVFSWTSKTSKYTQYIDLTLEALSEHSMRMKWGWNYCIESSKYCRGSAGTYWSVRTNCVACAIVAEQSHISSRNGRPALPERAPQKSTSTHSYARLNTSKRTGGLPGE